MVPGSPFESELEELMKMPKLPAGKDVEWGIPPEVAGVGKEILGQIEQLKAEEEQGMAINN